MYSSDGARVFSDTMRLCVRLCLCNKTTILENTCIFDRYAPTSLTIITMAKRAGGEMLIRGKRIAFVRFNLHLGLPCALQYKSQSRYLYSAAQEIRKGELTMLADVLFRVV